ncbi:unnamed protein product [Urochloa humidicola]
MSTFTRAKSDLAMTVSTSHAGKPERPRARSVRGTSRRLDRPATPECSGPAGSNEHTACTRLSPGNNVDTRRASVMGFLPPPGTFRRAAGGSLALPVAFTPTQMLLGHRTEWTSTELIYVALRAAA